MHGRIRAANILILLAMLAIPAAWGGWIYQSFRSWEIVFDVDWRDRVLLIALTGVLPAWYAFAVLGLILEFARWVRHRLLHRRVRLGGCWRCGYSADPQRPDCCTECGCVPGALPAYRPPGVRTVLIAAMLVAAAVVPAALLGDLYITAEDFRFIEEVRRQGGRHANYRDRAWPNANSALVFNPPSDFHATD